MCYHAGMKENLKLKLTVRLYSDDDERCFGPGIATLLHRVAEHRSLRAAAAAMGMAYSKAWTILKASETQLGFKLLHSTTGGKHGGGANLTPEADALLRAYSTYCSRLKTLARDLFEEEFQAFL